MDTDPDDRGRETRRDGEGQRPQAGHRRHHGDGKEHRPSHRCPTLRDGAAQAGRAKFFGS